MNSEIIAHYRNNCVLVALQEVSGRCDADILAAARKRGYRNNRGMYADQYHNAAMDLGLKLGKTRSEWEMRQEERRISGGDYNFKRLSLKTVIAKYLQRGVWLVRVQGHLLVVRGGKLVDRNWSRRAGLGRRVVDVVEVLNPHRPVIQGVIRVIRHNARKRGTGAHARFRHMTELVRLRPTITKEDLLKNSTYTEVDFAWDLQRGNIEII